MNGMAVGQATEDMVLKLYKNKQIWVVDTGKISYSNRHGSYHKITQKVIDERPELLYQGAFVFENLFIKSDILILNEDNKYDLIEVKSKNSIRKNTKEAPLLDDLLFDVSFQHYVLKQVLWGLYSGKAFLAYVNKEYIKEGPVNPHGLIIQEEVTDELLDAESIQNTADIMRENIPLWQKEFEALYPYEGNGYMAYFGQAKPKDSIRSIPRIGKKLLDFYPHKTKLEDFEEQDILDLYNSKGEKTRASNFVNLRKEWQTVIDKAAIQSRFDNELKFPLYFYDYETIARPVPLLDWTHPRQQVVVQYSLHKIDADGTIIHKEAIIQPGETDNKRIIKQLTDDFENGNGTYIVRYKGFENSRNTETAKMYPEYTEILEKVNNNTFDLMEIFSEQLYFDRDFQGSSSIKKVLPVLTDISYDKMNVWNGAVAADVLRKIAQNEIPATEAKKWTTDLLEYCKQDTRAMVRIRQVVKERIWL